MIYRVLLWTLCLATGIAAQNKIPVAVLEFKASGGITADEASILANRFRGILVNTDKFDVIEREQMHTILKEQDFSMSDNCNSQECAVQIGQLLGVKQMIAGSVGKLGQTWTIDLRLIDVEKGKILQNISKDHKGEIDGLLDVMKTIAAAFAGGKTGRSDDKNVNAMSLSQWEILGGTWYEKNGAIFGSGGHIVYREPLEDYTIELTVEKMAGPDWAAVSVMMRCNLFEGGGKQYRNHTSDLQGYGFNFGHNRRFNVFNGVGGAWYLMNPAWKEFQFSDALQEKVNRIRIENIKDQLSIYVNDRLIASFNDKTHGFGAPGFWVQEPSQIIKFSDIHITPK